MKIPEQEYKEMSRKYFNIITDAFGNYNNILGMDKEDYIDLVYKLMNECVVVACDKLIESSTGKVRYKNKEGHNVVVTAEFYWKEVRKLAE